MMDSGKSTLVATAIAVSFLVGCGDTSSGGEPAAGTGSAAKPAATATATAAAFKGPDPSKVGMECKRDMDCPDSGGYRSTCKFTCQKASGAETGYCQLQSVTSTAGATPCDGYQLGTSRVGGGTPDTKTPAMYFCDVNEGVYCDKKTKLCTPVKAVGADCGDSSKDCGKDALCDDKTKKCVAAAAVGASCKDTQCVSTAYCDSDSRLCVARAANGAPCKQSDQCQSLSCVSRNSSMTCEPDNKIACPL